jgi:hypothetical protein
MKKIIFIIIYILLYSSICFSANYSLTFSWTPNVEPDLAGYRLYQRDASSDYSTAKFYPIPKEAAQHTIGNIETISPLFFVLTAYDLSNNESGYSNEVSFAPDTIPPIAPGGLQINITVNVNR